jgi:hypothetical protein
MMKGQLARLVRWKARFRGRGPDFRTLIVIALTWRKELKCCQLMAVGTELRAYSSVTARTSNNVSAALAAPNCAEEAVF